MYVKEIVKILTCIQV